MHIANPSTTTRALESAQVLSRVHECGRLASGASGSRDLATKIARILERKHLFGGSSDSPACFESMARSYVHEHSSALLATISYITAGLECGRPQDRLVSNGSMRGYCRL